MFLSLFLRCFRVYGVSIFLLSHSSFFESNNLPISTTSILKGSEVAFPRALEATTVR